MPTEDLYEANSEPPEQEDKVVEVTKISKTLQLAGVSELNIEQAPAPSRPVNKINIPEVIKPKAKFVYNYFTRDERIRPDSTNDNERIIVLDASNTDEIFHRTRNKKLARFVRLEFNSPQVPAAFNNRFNLTKRFNLTNALNQIIVEGANSDKVFTGIEFMDTGKENFVYKMLNSALFFQDIPVEKNSNREAIAKLHATLEEKGGLKGQDKKLLFETFRNFNPSTGGNDSQQYVLAPSDVPPEVAKFADDPVSKQTVSVQFNNLFISELISSATAISDNVFQDELRSLVSPARNITTALLADLPPVHTFRELDYELEVKAVKLQSLPETSPAEKERLLAKYPEINFAGYLIEKFEVLPDETIEFLGRRYIKDHDTNYAIDSEVRYGGVYTYKIRTVCQVKVVIHTIADNPACDQAVLATCFMASEGENFSINCVERVPPPPPSNLRATFDFETLFPRISWQFPLNKQRDIKRFQIFKRLSVQEPFILLQEYNFDNSLVKTQVAELASDGKVVTMTRPRTYHVDVTHKQGEKPIYAIACVDAHGLSSNYSPQVMVERDRYTNKVKRTVISRANAPKPYPNMFLNVDTFQDAIKVSNYDRIKIIFDPEYYRVMKNDIEIRKGAGGSAGDSFNTFNTKVERDTNLLAIDNQNFRYKFHIINIDNQLDQIVKVKLFNFTSANGIDEDTFEVPVTDLSEDNLSFQYGVE
tara:strand:- start:16702 stop:18813 length:2112 start_codon:yes stop_codon:yes gene_type:complete